MLEGFFSTKKFYDKEIKSVSFPAELLPFTRNYEEVTRQFSALLSVTDQRLIPATNDKNVDAFVERKTGHFLKRVLRNISLS